MNITALSSVQLHKKNKLLFIMPFVQLMRSDEQFYAEIDVDHQHLLSFRLGSFVEASC